MCLNTDVVLLPLLLLLLPSSGACCCCNFGRFATLLLVSLSNSSGSPATVDPRLGFGTALRLEGGASGTPLGPAGGWMCLVVGGGGGALENAVVTSPPPFAFGGVVVSGGDRTAVVPSGHSTVSPYVGAGRTLVTGGFPGAL